MQWLKHPFLVAGKLWALGFIFVGGGLLATTILPVMGLFPGRKHDRAQVVIHFLFRFYIQMIQFLGLIRLDIQHPEKFAQCGGKIVVANHPSLLDVVILMSLIPKIQCIVKHELWDHPLLRGLVRQAGYIRNDLAPEELVASCKASLDEGRCLIIFPEGTRTVPGATPRFHRGFANVATLTEASIQPVVINCYPPFLFKGEALLHFPSPTPYFRVAPGECLDARSYSLYGQRSIAARKLVEALELYYAKHVSPGQP